MNTDKKITFNNGAKFSGMSQFVQLGNRPVRLMMTERLYNPVKVEEQQKEVEKEMVTSEVSQTITAPMYQEPIIQPTVEPIIETAIEPISEETNVLPDGIQPLNSFMPESDPVIKPVIEPNIVDPNILPNDIQPLNVPYPEVNAEPKVSDLNQGIPYQFNQPINEVSQPAVSELPVEDKAPTPTFTSAVDESGNLLEKPGEEVTEMEEPETIKKEESHQEMSIDELISAVVEGIKQIGDRFEKLESEIVGTKEKIIELETKISSVSLNNTDLETINATLTGATRTIEGMNQQTVQPQPYAPIYPSQVQNETELPRLAA